MLAAAIVIWPVRPEIGGVQGIIFWTALTFVASVLPVTLPKGLIVSVAFAPLVAALFLGGPTAMAIVVIRLERSTSVSCAAGFRGTGCSTTGRVSSSRPSHPERSWKS